MFELQPSEAMKNTVSAVTCSVPRTACPGTVATKSYIPSADAATSRLDAVPPPLAHDSVTKLNETNALIPASPASLNQFYLDSAGSRLVTAQTPSAARDGGSIDGDVRDPPHAAVVVHAPIAGHALVFSYRQ
jgi:hypothetical protein